MRYVKKDKIEEIGFTKYLPFSIKKDTVKEFEAEFKIKGEDVKLQDTNGEWVDLAIMYPGATSITYKVTLTRLTSTGRIIKVNREGLETQIKVFIHTLAFSNSLSGMSNLKSNLGTLVFSTIAKILTAFQDHYQDPADFQCISFTPAYGDLVPVYEILSREAEKQGNLIYANKETGKRDRHWYLLNKNIFNALLKRLGKE